ncbi:MAG TPA: ester cyclase [Ktedonobacterales bacterium]|nr:ester cyclase [Ktedonobacterales bacterium]
MGSDAETVERVFRTVIEQGFSKGDLAAIDAVVAPDFIEHQRGASSGVEALKGMVRHLRGWFPDLTLTIEDLVVSGDKAWGRIVARSTHTQTVMGRPPTGAPVRLDIIDIMRVVDGKVVEHWGVPDQLALMEQIGVIPRR